eukprot:gene12578-13768_t
MSVKMRTTCAWTVGDIETSFSEFEESPVRYHSEKIKILTSYRKPVERQFQVGSLTGAVASQKVTEAYKGSLRSVRNRSSSAKAKGSLTVRQTSRAETKVGLSDLTMLCGKVVTQRIKVTLGITG